MTTNHPLKEKEQNNTAYNYHNGSYNKMKILESDKK